MSTIKSSAEDLTLNADGSNEIKFQINAVEKASLSDAGLLTTSGGAALDGAVTINSSNADVDFKVGCETGAYNVDAEDYALWVEGSTGAVLIGTDTNTDDSVNLLVTRSGLTSMEIYASADSSARDATLRLHTRNAAAQCRIRFLDGAAPGTTAGEIYYNHDGDTMYFHTADTQRAQINANGLCLGTGNLVIGTAGKGIMFHPHDEAVSNPGSDSNLLDDYEEGTWTGVVSDGTNNATMDAGTQSYVKIGKQVTLCGYLSISSLGSVSGNTRITGLPFTAGKHASTGLGHSINLAITAGHSVGLLIDAGYDFLYPTVSDTTVGTSLMQAYEWSDDGFINISFTYFTA